MEEVTTAKIESVIMEQKGEKREVDTALPPPNKINIPDEIPKPKRKYTRKKSSLTTSTLPNENLNMNSIIGATGSTSSGGGGSGNGGIEMSEIEKIKKLIRDIYAEYPEYAQNKTELPNDSKNLLAIYSKLRQSITLRSTLPFIHLISLEICTLVLDFLESSRPKMFSPGFKKTFLDVLEKNITIFNEEFEYVYTEIVTMFPFMAVDNIFLNFLRKIFTIYKLTKMEQKKTEDLIVKTNEKLKSNKKFKQL